MRVQRENKIETRKQHRLQAYSKSMIQKQGRQYVYKKISCSEVLTNHIMFLLGSKDFVKLFNYALFTTLLHSAKKATFKRQG